MHFCNTRLQEKAESEKEKKTWSARFLFSFLMCFHWKYFLLVHRLSFGTQNLQSQCSEISALVSTSGISGFLFKDDLNVGVTSFLCNFKKITPKDLLARSEARLDFLPLMHCNVVLMFYKMMI